MAGLPEGFAESVDRAIELLNVCGEEADRIYALAFDSEDDLTALGTALLVGSMGAPDERWPETIKVCLLSAFHLGYLQGKSEGDLSIWEE